MPKSAVLGIAFAGLLAGSAIAGECAVDNGPDAPEPLKIGETEYPAAAVLDRIEGRGVAQVKVDSSGRVSAGVIVTDAPGNYRLGQAVLNTLLMKSRFKSGHRGQYQLCFDFKLPAEQLAVDPSLPEAPLASGGPIMGIHSPAALAAGKDGTAMVDIEIDAQGVVTKIGAVTADPAGFQLERAAAAMVGHTQFEENKAGRYRASVFFNAAALEVAYEAGKLPEMPGVFLPETDPDDYPDRAASNGSQGYVDLDLDIADNGLLKRMDILREVPKGYGYALMALVQANKAILHPMIQAQHVKFTMNFVLRFGVQ